MVARWHVEATANVQKQTLYVLLFATVGVVPGAHMIKHLNVNNKKQLSVQFTYHYVSSYFYSYLMSNYISYQ